MTKEQQKGKTFASISYSLLL